MRWLNSIGEKQKTVRLESATRLGLVPAPATNPQRKIELYHSTTRCCKKWVGACVLLCTYFGTLWAAQITHYRHPASQKSHQYFEPRDVLFPSLPLFGTHTHTQTKSTYSSEPAPSKYYIVKTASLVQPTRKVPLLCPKLSQVPQLCGCAYQ